MPPATMSPLKPAYPHLQPQGPRMNHLEHRGSKGLGEAAAKEAEAVALLAAGPHNLQLTEHLGDI